MKHLKNTIAVLLLASGLLTPAVQANSASLLLQEGLYAEETEGDLEKAIGLYEQVLGQYKDVERLAARATYQLGMCYLKKGEKTKAAEYFQQVISNYSTQKITVKKAEEQLKKVKPETKASVFEQIDYKVIRFERVNIATTKLTDTSIWLATQAISHIWQHKQYRIFDNTALDLDTGATIGFSKEVPCEYDVSWDNDAGGVLMVGPKKCARIIGLSGVEKAKHGEAIEAAEKVIGMLRTSPSRGIPAEQVAFCAVLTDQGNLAVIEFAEYSPEKATLNVWMKGRTDKHHGRGSSSEGLTSVGWELLDEETRQAIERFEKSFAGHFKNETRYELADNVGKRVIVDEWKSQAVSDNFKTRVRAIAGLGNVKAVEAIDTLIKIAEEPMRNNRPKWLAVRGLAEIRDPRAVPTLIGLVDHGNLNVRVYARLALARITGVYFHDDKSEWKRWWMKNRTQFAVRDTKGAEKLSQEGWQLWGQRKLAKAEEKFQQAIEKDPAYENAYQGLGWAQYNQGKKLNAKDSFEQCVKLNPKNSAALNGLGWIAHGQGNTDEAIQWWEKAVEAQPGATASLNGLTKVYMEKKEYNKAIKYYEMWLKAEPDNEQAKEGMEKAKASNKN